MDKSAGVEENQTYLEEIAESMTEKLLEIPGVHRTGDPVHHLPGFRSFIVEGIPHSVLLVNELNTRNICISSGSACSASSREASHVLLAMGYDKELSSNTLRITPGPENTKKELLEAAELLHAAILRIRAEQIKRAPRLEGKERSPQ